MLKAHASLGYVVGWDVKIGRSEAEAGVLEVFAIFVQVRTPLGQVLCVVQGIH